MSEFDDLRASLSERRADREAARVESLLAGEAVIGLDFDVGETAAETDDDARDAAVADEKVGAEADGENGEIAGCVFQEVGEVGFIGRRVEDLRCTADTEPRDVGHHGIGGKAAAQVWQLGFEAGRDVGEDHVLPPSQLGKACAHSVLLPAPRQTTMSLGLATARSIGTSSRSW